MDFRALFIKVKSIIFILPFLRSPINVFNFFFFFFFFFYFGYFVVPDEIKGNFFYLLTIVFMDWQFG